VDLWKPTIFNGDDINWETIEVFLFILTLEDKEICFDGEDKLSENNYLLEYLVDDFPYKLPQDQDQHFNFSIF